MSSAAADLAEVNDTKETEADDDIEFLFHQAELQEEEAQQRIVTVASGSDLAAQEMVWQYADKPMLWIGAKGATHTHGNSLRQLLEDHVVVKVKANTKKFGTFFFHHRCLTTDPTLVVSLLPAIVIVSTYFSLTHRIPSLSISFISVYVYYVFVPKNDNDPPPPPTQIK